MRWIRRIAAVLAALVILILAVIYGGSEWIIRRGHAVPLRQIAIPRDAASIAEGGRLARAYACLDCHKQKAQGAVLFEAAAVGRIVAPAFASVAPSYSDAELVRLIRHGVRRDGAGQIIMPSDAYVHMADEDVARIVAWMRTLKPAPADVTGRSSYGPVGRALLLAGKIPMWVMPGEIASPARRPADVGGYYVGSMCAACHALHEEKVMADTGDVAPPLAMMAASYGDAEFAELLRTGKLIGGRKGKMMPLVAPSAFSSYTPEEVAAIHAYLKGEAEKAPAQ